MADVARGPVVVFAATGGGHREYFNGLLFEALLGAGRQVSAAVAESIAENAFYRECRGTPGLRLHVLRGDWHDKRRRLGMLMSLGAWVRALRAEHLYLEALDDAVPFLWLLRRINAGRAFEAPWSAHFFRACAHYRHLGAPSDWLAKPGNRIRESMRHALLGDLVRDPGLRSIHVNDEFAVDHYNRAMGRPVFRRTADPVLESYFSPSQTRDQARASLGLPPRDYWFVSYGSHSAKKASDLLIEAFIGLNDHERTHRAGLFLAGPILDQAVESALASPQARELARRGGLVVHDRFLDQAQSLQCLSAADCVVVPHRDHMGNSSVLIKAVITGRRVIYSDQNWMSLFHRRYGLGRLFTHGSAQSLRLAMAEEMNHPQAIPDFPDKSFYLAGNFQRSLLADLESST